MSDLSSETDCSLFTIRENPCNLYSLQWKRAKNKPVKAPGKYLRVADKVLDSVTLASL